MSTSLPDLRGRPRRPDGQGCGGACGCGGDSEGGAVRRPPAAAAPPAGDDSEGEGGATTGTAAGLPVALVLGAAVGPGGRPSPALRRRALHGAGLVLAGRAGHLLACGGHDGRGGHGGPAEADVIAALARAAGVAPGRISREDRSTSTEENLARARPILARLGGPPVLVVTDRFHAPRALLLARAMGMRATASCPPAGDTPPVRRLWLYAREAAAVVRTLWRRARGRYRQTSTSIQDGLPPTP
ncbi:MAG: YdcF family protein [Rhodobacteraceae bacterium]|nr:YdcF family protein [Paracoccaceae bacterium]